MKSKTRLRRKTEHETHPRMYTLTLILDIHASQLSKILKLPPMLTWEAQSEGFDQDRLCLGLEAMTRSVLLMLHYFFRVSVKTITS